MKRFVAIIVAALVAAFCLVGVSFALPAQDSADPSLEYGYKITPQIYKKLDSGYRQVNPDKTISAMGVSSEDNLLTGMMSNVSTTNTFRLCALGTIDTPDIEAFFQVLREAFEHEGIQIPARYND